MKQHFFLIVVSAFIATIVVSVVTLVFNPADAFHHIITVLMANPNDHSQKIASFKS